MLIWGPATPGTVFSFCKFESLRHKSKQTKYAITKRTFRKHFRKQTFSPASCHCRRSERIKSRINRRNQKTVRQNGIQPTKKWLKSPDVRKLLNISAGTLQNLRVNKTIPFTKIGGVIFYDSDDIQKMLQSRKHWVGQVIAGKDSAFSCKRIFIDSALPAFNKGLLSKYLH